jgi:50S ribosomal protein L16 3-hydroxylase
LFSQISRHDFFAYYWQKKPFLFKQAFKNFNSPISPDELAGLALEDVFESRLIMGCIEDNRWDLEVGAFDETRFQTLPERNWSLLVQGLDRFIPDIHNLIKPFDFIPRWNFDDVMMSYATPNGSVGPHFDFYDVFLLQSSGRKRWSLSTLDCTLDNYLTHSKLRIMQTFKAEQTFEVEAGDVLYIPPKVAHFGISLDETCTTLSFGYRSYSFQELATFAGLKTTLEGYLPISIDTTQSNACLPDIFIQTVNQYLPIDKQILGCFVTYLDIPAQQILQDFALDMQNQTINTTTTYALHPVVKITYYTQENKLTVFINGETIATQESEAKPIIDFCNLRKVQAKKCPIFLSVLLDKSYLLTV